MHFGNKCTFGGEKQVHSFHRASHDFSSMYFARILEEKKKVILPQKPTWGEILN